MPDNMYGVLISSKELRHFGVKGMRWGIRKNRKSGAKSGGKKYNSKLDKFFGIYIDSKGRRAPSLKTVGMFGVITAGNVLITRQLAKESVSRTMVKNVAKIVGNTVVNPTGYLK